MHEITVDEQGKAKSAVYQDADGDFVEQEVDVFMLACGAIESARLLLLSRSNRFPHGLANSNGLVGRYLTLHEYSGAVGIFDEPVYGWAGGGYISASTLEFYGSDEKRGFIGGCYVAAAASGLSFPMRCIEGTLVDVETQVKEEVFF